MNTTIVLCLAILAITFIFYCLIQSVVNSSKSRKEFEISIKKMEYKNSEKKVYLDFCYDLAKKKTSDIKDPDLIETRKRCCDFLSKYTKQFIDTVTENGKS